MKNATTIDEKINDKNVVDTSKKTFKLAQLARQLGHNEKIVRSRFRRYVVNDDVQYDVVRKTLQNAKTRWVYAIGDIDAITKIIVRVDDE